MFDSRKIILKAGLATAAVIIGLTVFVGVAGHFLGIKSLGVIDHVMYPGGICGWLFIWGDNFSNSVAQRLTAIGISAAINGCIGFIIGICFCERSLAIRERARKC